MISLILFNLASVLGFIGIKLLLGILDILAALSDNVEVLTSVEDFLLVLEQEVRNHLFSKCESF